MDQKPRIRLFSWRRAIIPLLGGIVVVSYRTYESYQGKGHLTASELWAAAVTVAIMFGIFAAIGWWANRPE